MVHIAIVEDEDNYATKLMSYLDEFEKERGIKIAADRFADGEDIVERYKSDYDIILMDIQMRFMDGMTAAERIRAMDNEVTIMFITNMSQYAIRGYEVRAFDYILKPIEYFSFSQKFGRAVDRLQTRGVSYISIPTGTSVQKVAVNDVAYVESFGHRIVFHLINKNEIVSRGVMNDIEKKLLSYNFFRVNNSFIVNMTHVNSVSGAYCMVADEKVSISRQKKDQFMMALAKCFGERIGG